MWIIVYVPAPTLIWVVLNAAMASVPAMRMAAETKFFHEYTFAPLATNVAAGAGWFGGCAEQHVGPSCVRVSFLNVGFCGDIGE